MFDLSPDKILMLGILALVVLGPNRLPEAARTAGRFLGQLRRMSSSFESEVRQALSEPGEALSSVVTELRPPDIRGGVRRTITAAFTPEPKPTQPTPWTGPPNLASDGVIIPPAPDDPALN